MLVRRLGLDFEHAQVVADVAIYLPAGVVLDVDGARDTWWFMDDHELATTPPELEASVTPTQHGALVEVRARTLARELCLLVDHAAPEARVDQALVTLLPTESTVFRVTAPGTLTPDTLEALGRAPVLRAANDLMPRR